MQVILKAKNNEAQEIISKNGNIYKFLKIIGNIRNSNFVILLKARGGSEANILVNIERDKDFVVKFN